MRPQFKRVRDVVAALNIPIYELDGFEADDLLGTLALQANRCACARSSRLATSTQFNWSTTGCA